MAKKDTIIALRNRGIEESTAWMLVDAGFTISQLRRSKISDLTKHLSEDSAKNVLKKMGVKLVETDKKKKGTSKGKETKTPAPTKKVKAKEGKPAAGSADKKKKEEEESDIAFLWSEPKSQRITSYRKLLNKDEEAVFGVEFKKGNRIRGDATKHAAQSIDYAQTTWPEVGIVPILTYPPISEEYFAHVLLSRMGVGELRTNGYGDLLIYFSWALIWRNGRFKGVHNGKRMSFKRKFGSR